MPPIRPRLPLNQIVCGDNVTVMKAFPDACIDLVVTSPPYDNLRTYGGHSWDFEGVAEQLTRILKPGGVIVWVVADATIDGSETGTSFRQALHFKDVCGLRLHDTMIYEKAGCPFPETNRYYPTMEMMFVLSRGKPKSVNLIADQKNVYAGDPTARKSADRQPNGELKPNSSYKLGNGRCVKDFGVRSNVWRYAIGRGNSSSDVDAFKHSAIFPESLARDHILSWSNVGDLVLDPFVGSGTTTKMARDTGRLRIGIDVHEDYCKIARQRTQAAHERRLRFEEAERKHAVGGLF